MDYLLVISDESLRMFHMLYVLGEKGLQILVEGFASAFNCTRWVGLQTSVSDGWCLTINVCVRAHRNPVCGFLVSWLPIAIESFLIFFFHNCVCDNVCLTVMFY